MSQNEPNDRRSSLWRVGLALPAPSTPHRLEGVGFFSAEEMRERLFEIEQRRQALTDRLFEVAMRRRIEAPWR